MVRIIFFSLFIISFNNKLAAQQQPAETKKTTASPTYGFKKQSSFPVADKRSIPANQAPRPSDIQKVTFSSPPALSAAERKLAAKASEIIKTDYNNMPVDVQLKINSNKARGKYLLDGIAKAFNVQMKICQKDSDQKKVLGFLKQYKGFLNSQWISPGLVKIIVDPTFDSPELKDAMDAKGLQFNFLNRTYFLKN